MGARGIKRRLFGQAEIEEDDLAALVEFEVLRFDVTMNDRWVLRMEVFERSKHLVGPGQRIDRWNGASIDTQYHRQVFAADILHHEKLTIAFGEVIDHFRKSLVAQGCQYARLAVKGHPHRFID